MSGLLWIGRFFFLKSLQFYVHFPHAVSAYSFLLMIKSLLSLLTSWYCRDTSISAFRSVASDDESVFIFNILKIVCNQMTSDVCNHLTKLTETEA